jgi:hypothetical protein
VTRATRFFLSTRPIFQSQLAPLALPICGACFWEDELLFSEEFLLALVPMMACLNLALLGLIACAK